MNSKVTCWLLPIFIFPLILGCIREAPYLGFSDDAVVFLEGRSQSIDRSIYTEHLLTDSLVVSVVVRRHSDLKGKFISKSSNSVLVDIMVSPKDRAKTIEYYPDRVQIVVQDVPLVLFKSKVRCGHPDMCYHSAVFLMPDLADVGVSSDTVWCRLDLSGALSYRGHSLDIDVIEGYLPRIQD